MLIRRVFMSLNLLASRFVPIDAIDCMIGGEYLQSDEQQTWVFAQPNPCNCINMILGGFNIDTPTRPYEPEYFVGQYSIDHYKKDCGPTSGMSLKLTVRNLYGRHNLLYK